MPRDYKTRATPQRKKAATPGWVWFLGGLLVGPFISGLAWLKFSGGDNPLFTQEQSLPSPKMKKVEKPKAASQKTKAAPKPRFDFYTILPEMEVVVPEPEPEFKPAPGDTPKVRDAVSQLPWLVCGSSVSATIAASCVLLLSISVLTSAALCVEKPTAVTQFP